MGLPFKIETPEERAARRVQAAMAQTQGKVVTSALPVVPPPVDLQPTMRPIEPVPGIPEKPAIDPAILAGIQPSRPDPGLDAIYANHNAERASRGLGPEASLENVATTDQDPTVVFRDKRPDTAYGPDDLEAKLALKKSIDEQEPQKTKGWKKWLPILLQAGGVVGGITSRDSRAAAQNAYGLGQSLANPRMADENWKRGKQAEVGAEIDDIYKQQDRAADTAYRTARTNQLNQPAAAKPKRLQLRQNEEGLFVPVDLDTGLGPDGKPVKGRTPAAPNEWSIRQNAEGIFVPVNNKTGLGQDGKTVQGASLIQQPDGSFVSAGAVFTKNKQVEDDIRSVEQKNDAARQENAVTQANIASIKERRAKVASALKDTDKEIDDHDSFGVKIGRKANPRYRALEMEDVQLDEELRRANASLKPILKAPAKPTVVTSGRSKIPAKTNRAQQLKELGIQ